MLAECITLQVPQIAGMIFAAGFIVILIFAGIQVYRGGNDEFK